MMMCSVISLTTLAAGSRGYSIVRYVHVHAMSSLLLSAHVTTFCSLHNGCQFVVVVVVYCLFVCLFVCLPLCFSV